MKTWQYGLRSCCSSAGTNRYPPTLSSYYPPTLSSYCTLLLYPPTAPSYSILLLHHAASCAA
eukprot:3141397-Rhodomonas_salina.1